MSLLENFAYFLPLCVAVGLTTAVTRSDNPARVAFLAVKYIVGLAVGISLLAVVLLVINAIL